MSETLAAEFRIDNGNIFPTGNVYWSNILRSGNFASTRRLLKFPAETINNAQNAHHLPGAQYSL